jgi:TRAP-type C4-dicarboxylate transport system permease small subunit
MSASFLSASRLARTLDRVLVTTTAASLFAMMAFTFADVVLRYLFAQPVRGGLEVVELLMVAMIFSGLPLVSRRDEHVTIDTIESRLPDPVRAGLRRVMHAVAAAGLAGAAWLMARKAATLAEFGDRTQLLGVPIAPFVFFMAALLAVTALVHLAKTFTAGESAEAAVRVL